jgi:hypothetical protein
MPNRRLAEDRAVWSVTTPGERPLTLTTTVERTWAILVLRAKRGDWIEPSGEKWRKLVADLAQRGFPIETRTRAGVWQARLVGPCERASG